MATASFHHHHAVLVADVERAGRFYIDVFGGRWLSRPVVIVGRAAQQFMDGPRGTEFKLGIVGFDEGAIELFEFLPPTIPAWAADHVPRRLPHLGVRVDDVVATLAAVEAAGGHRLFPELGALGDADLIYVSDPDGNVLELLNVGLRRIAELMVDMFPDAARGGGASYEPRSTV